MKELAAAVVAAVTSARLAAAVVAPLDCKSVIRWGI